MKKAALLAPAACALAFALAGCGGSGTAAGTTTTGQGGVLGASGNLNQARAHVEIGHVNAILNGSLRQLAHAHSQPQVTRLATQASAQLRAEAARIQGLSVPANARQAQRNLVSSLQSLATDVDTIKGDVQMGSWQAALAASTHLSSAVAVRSSLQSFRRAVSRNAGSVGGSATTTKSSCTDRDFDGDGSSGGPDDGDGCL